MSDTKMAIKNKFGSIEVYENVLLINKNFMKEEVEFYNIKAIHFQKANMMGGYIRFVIDENANFDKYGDKTTLLYSKENEEESDKFTSELATLIGKEKVVIEAPQTDFKIIGAIFGWSISIILAIMGFALMSEEFGLGLFFLLVALSLVPPLKKIINSKINTLLEKSCSKEWQIKVGTGVIKFCAFFILLIIIAACSPTNNQPNTANNSTKATTTSSKQFKNNKNTKKIAEITGLNKEQAANVYKTLVSCGVGNITNIELFAKYEGASDAYYIYPEGVQAPIVTYIDSNGNVTEAYYNMSTIINDKGQRVAKLQDYVLTYDEWLDLRVKGQLYIEKFLLAPSTAKFHNQAYVIDDNKIIQVGGTVEAKNAFGVPLSTPFMLQYKKVDGNFVLIKGTLGTQVIY